MIVTNGHGGPRKGGGPKPHWFRDEMEDLIRKLSPKIAEFAESVFNNEPMEPVKIATGVIYVQASVRDKTVLLATLARLGGLLDMSESPLREPLQKVIDQVQAIKLMQELNYGAKSGGNGNGAASVMGNGHPPAQAEGPPA